MTRMGERELRESHHEIQRDEIRVSGKSLGENHPEWNRRPLRSVGSCCGRRMGRTSGGHDSVLRRIDSYVQSSAPR